MYKNKLRRNPAILAGIAICSMCWGWISHAQEDAGKLAPLLESIGDYSYPVSNCSESAQRFFDQGLRLYYGFYFPEAVASFREAKRLDRACPMVHWGEALAIAPTPNSRYNRFPDDPEGVGTQAIRRAVALEDRASERERGLIEALHILYDSTAQHDSPQRDRGYADALRALHVRYPYDPEVGTLYAAALMTLSAWQYFTPDGRPRPGTSEAMESLSSVLRDHPDHPGANHLFIHLVENSQYPDVALLHADRLAASMPGAGHIVHMPSHIYIRTGRYAEAIESNRNSLAADRIFLAAWGDREVPMGIASTPLSATNHGVHAEDFLHMAAVLQGNYADAISSAQKVAALAEPQLAASGKAQRRYVRSMLTDRRFGRWDTILNEPAPDPAYPFVTGIWHYVRGSAYVATGNLTEAQRELEKVRAAANTKGMQQLMVAFNSASTILSLADHVLTSEIAVQRGDLDQALAHLESAVRIEDGLAYQEPPDWGDPVRLSLGQALLEAGRPKEAEVVYWEDLRRNPENGWSLFGVWQSLLQQGSDARAAEIEERFRKAWAHADVTLTGGRPTIKSTAPAAEAERSD